MWIAPALEGVDPQKSDFLVEELRRISTQKNDRHADSPVCDILQLDIILYFVILWFRVYIIDPDLFPYKREQADYVKNKIKEYADKQRRHANVS